MQAPNEKLEQLLKKCNTTAASNERKQLLELVVNEIFHDFSDAKPCLNTILCNVILCCKLIHDNLVALQLIEIFFQRLNSLKSDLPETKKDLSEIDKLANTICKLSPTSEAVASMLNTLDSTAFGVLWFAIAFAGIRNFILEEIVAVVENYTGFMDQHFSELDEEVVEHITSLMINCINLGSEAKALEAIARYYPSSKLLPKFLHRTVGHLVRKSIQEIVDEAKDIEFVLEYCTDQVMLLSANKEWAQCSTHQEYCIFLLDFMIKYLDRFEMTAQFRKKCLKLVPVLPAFLETSIIGRESQITDKGKVRYSKYDKAFGSVKYYARKLLKQTQSEDTEFWTQGFVKLASSSDKHERNVGFVALAAVAHWLNSKHEKSIDLALKSLKLPNARVGACSFLRTEAEQIHLLGKRKEAFLAICEALSASSDYEFLDWALDSLVALIHCTPSHLHTCLSMEYLDMLMPIVTRCSNDVENFAVLIHLFPLIFSCIQSLESPQKHTPLLIPIVRNLHGHIGASGQRRQMFFEMITDLPSSSAISSFFKVLFESYIIPQVECYQYESLMKATHRFLGCLGREAVDVVTVQLLQKMIDWLKTEEYPDALLSAFTPMSSLLYCTSPASTLLRDQLEELLDMILKDVAFSMTHPSLGSTSSFVCLGAFVNVLWKTNAPLTKLKQLAEKYTALYFAASRSLLIDTLSSSLTSSFALIFPNYMASLFHNHAQTYTEAATIIQQGMSRELQMMKLDGWLEVVTHCLLYHRESCFYTTEMEVGRFQTRKRRRLAHGDVRIEEIESDEEKQNTVVALSAEYSLILTNGIKNLNYFHLTTSQRYKVSQILDRVRNRTLNYKITDIPNAVRFLRHLPMVKLEDQNFTDVVVLTTKNMKHKQRKRSTINVI